MLVFYLGKGAQIDCDNFLGNHNNLNRNHNHLEHVLEHYPEFLAKPPFSLTAQPSQPHQEHYHKAR